MKRISSNKEVVLGVTGSIAAYKACEIASRLVELGARVTPVLTRSARELAAPAAFEALCGRRAILEMFGPLQNPEIEHIAVAERAALFLIAPATANILAKTATGIADDWLSTTLLATRAPILFAPAMNCNMWSHPATVANVETLRGRGCHFVGPAEGRLACGAIGVGRMIDPRTVVEAALPFLNDKRDLQGKCVLITSGSTREPIDPVRYIGNRSSGKMGRALALEALCRGAQVIVVTGPADVTPPHGARVHAVETAAEMERAVAQFAPQADILIGAAAVGDYRPRAADTKLKRTGESVSLTLDENPDIIAGVGASKRPGQIVVGFAAETDDLRRHAEDKLRRKNLDIVLANEVGKPGAGFGADHLQAILITRDGAEGLGRATKAEIAETLLDRAMALLAK